MNDLFQGLHLRKSLLLLALLTLIKDFILERNRNDTDIEPDDNIIDFEFVKWIAKLAFCNTNMNAFWKITHLRSFLVSLLLKNGFRNLRSEDLDELNVDQMQRTTK